MTEIQTAALIIHTIDGPGGGTTPRSMLDTAARILTESVDLDLDVNDMTADQQRNTADALKAIAGMLSAYARDFGEAAKHSAY
ncbi:hypothetical protein B5M44_21535 [Shinella sumterensis]|uniref:hypothetical protein n=1 Tax=Shinella sumterensis TaxID=1967501 RepID=UPI00106E81FB|nr:hypothetical protein [Shinella sumterensis]MCD1266842.1 hypothetical protein [Shinella sumterensis]TFE95300.1 hypothetical protein B5M44_21535 [Shinella sumterensis]